MESRTERIVEITAFNVSGSPKSLKQSAVSALDQIGERNPEAKAVMDKWREKLFDKDSKPSVARRNTAINSPSEPNEASPGMDVMQLHWEILPIGWWDDPKYDDQISGALTQGGRKLIIDRLKFINTLVPKKCYVGSNGFGERRYYVFVFPSHVVAECPLEGNAIYVLAGIEDWKNILRQSKTMVRKNESDRLKVIKHRGEWQERLKQALKL